MATLTFAVCQRTQRPAWIEDYTMLAFVEEGPTTAFAVNVGKSWYILVLPAVGFIFIAIVILVISSPVIVWYRWRHSAG